MKPAHFVIAALATTGGWYGAIVFRQPPGVLATHEAGARRILLYQSPMHPWVKSDKPGKCTVCGMDLVPIYEGEKSLDHAASDIVMLPPGSPTVIGVRTAEVKRQPLIRTLRVSGMIGEDESRHGVICAPVEGRIDGLAMNHSGQQVTRRQPLATVFSRTLLAAANDYKLALEQGGAPLDQSRRRLDQYGLVPEQINTIPTRQPDDPYFGVLAPLTGTIVKTYVSEGQYVSEGEKLFEIADFTKMWFMFSASEKDLPFLKAGQPVTLSVPSVPGETLKAPITFIDPNLDEMTHSAMVRVVLENPERRIKNKSYAEGIVELEAPEVIAVPRAAVLWPGHSARVYVEKAAGAYQQRSVKLGRTGDSFYEVLDGLKEGERVVLSGNMLIDGQSQLDSAGTESNP